MGSLKSKDIDTLPSLESIKPSKQLPSLDDMVIVPAKTVILGGGKGGALPAYEVKTEAFLISKTETTNKEFKRFVDETGYVTVAERYGNSVVFITPDKFDLRQGSSGWQKDIQGASWKHPEGPNSDYKGRENMPVVHVTLEDAMAYAKWAGREIMTEAQFRAAATSGDKELPPKEMLEPSPKQANFYQGNFPTENLATDGYVGLAPVASYPPNKYGIYDLIGNGWEITRTSSAVGESVVAAGGSYLCSWKGGFTCKNASPFGHTKLPLDTSAGHVTFRTVKRISK